MIDFELFWKIWPVKKAKHPARKAWEKLKPDEEMFKMIEEDIQNRFIAGEWEMTRKQYIPHASTYLNQRRFEDEEYIGAGIGFAR